MKTIMTSLSIAILTLCLLNVAAATTSNPASVPHSKIVADAAASQPTTLTFTAPAQAKVKESFVTSGSLTAGDKGVSGAIIKIHTIQNGQWVNFGNSTTDSGGNFRGSITTFTPGDHHYKVTYDGDSQYAPSASNEVVVTVS